MSWLITSMPWKLIARHNYAFKARLIKEGYPKEIREQKDVGLHSLDLELDKIANGDRTKSQSRDFSCQFTPQ